VATQVILSLPCFQQQVRIARPHAALRIPFNQVVFFQATADSAHVTGPELSRAGEFRLTPPSLRLGKQDAGQARTLGCEYGRRPTPLHEQVGLAGDMNTQTRRVDVRVPGQVHVTHTMFLADLAADLAHEGDRDQRNRRRLPFAGGLASVLGRLGNQARSGVGLDLHGQQVRPEAQQEISVLLLPDTLHRQVGQFSQEIGKPFQDVVLGDHHH